jgi:hypothetical protein
MRLLALPRKILQRVWRSGSITKRTHISGYLMDEETIHDIFASQDPDLLLLLH